MTAIPTTSPSPEQDALQRLQFLSNTASQRAAEAKDLLDTAFKDAVGWQTGQASVPCPQILTRPGLTALSNLHKGLAELAGYYLTQLGRFRQATGQQEKSPEAIAFTEQAKIDALRREIEGGTAATMGNIQQVQQAAAQARVEAAAAEPAPATLNDGTPTVSAARQAQAARLAMLGGEDVDATLPKIRAGQLPVAQPIQDGTVSQRQENSLAKLFGDESPLLDYVAGAPWCPRGRGQITVGSKGYKWYRERDPMSMTATERCGLPTGFYGDGPNGPQFVVLRAQSVILIWGFDLNPESVLMYMVGVSDIDPQNPRWLHPTSLSASFSRRLVAELTDLVVATRG